MNFKRVVAGELRTNTYVIYSGDSAMVIDPAHDSDRLIKNVGDYKVEKVVLTHGHLDHIYAVNYFRNKYPDVMVYIHKDDESYLNDYNKSAPQGLPASCNEDVYRVDEFLKENDELVFGEYTFKIIHTPGHSPGSICLLCQDILFSGDTLFCNGIGRTDFPGGNEIEMMNSLRELMKLPDDIKVYPGHGLSTTIKNSKQMLGIK